MVVKLFTLETLSEEKIASSFEKECTAAGQDLRHPSVLPIEGAGIKFIRKDGNDVT